MSIPSKDRRSTSPTTKRVVLHNAYMNTLNYRKGAPRCRFRWVRIDHKGFQTCNKRYSFLRYMVLNLIRLDSNKIEIKDETTYYPAGQCQALGKFKVVVRTYILYINMKQKKPSKQLTLGCDQIKTKTVGRKVWVLQCMLVWLFLVIDNVFTY